MPRAVPPRLDALASGDDPATTVQRLFALARGAGAPDDVACVVADVPAA